MDRSLQQGPPKVPSSTRSEPIEPQDEPGDEKADPRGANSAWERAEKERALPDRAKRRQGGGTGDSPENKDTRD